MQSFEFALPLQSETLAAHPQDMTELIEIL